MRFIFDENLGRRIPKIMEECFSDHDIRNLKSYTKLGTKDPDLFERLGSESGSVVLVTLDSKQVQRKPELRLIVSLGISVILIKASASNLAAEHRAWRLIRVWTGISEHIGDSSGPIRLSLDLMNNRIAKLTL